MLAKHITQDCALAHYEAIKLDPTIILLKCRYSQKQLDSCKVQLLYCTVKYYDIKWFVYDQYFTLNCQTLTAKSKNMNESS